jgi:dephospho-CoA kinase
LVEQIEIDSHPSETVLDTYSDFDYVIDNDGTIEELIEKVKEIWQT